MSGALLDVRGLSVAFGPTRALSGIDLALEPGTRRGRVGESGAGKSTLGRAVLGLLPRDAAVTGSVRFQGEPLPIADDRAMTRYRGSRIGFIYQDPMSAFSPVHTIGTHLVRALRAARPGIGRRDAEARAVALLEEVEISRPRERLRHYPHEYSGGMLQRVMIAAALVGDPDLLIADEPTTALDVTTQALVLRMLDRVVAARTMGFILVSHDLGVVAEACREVAVLYGGKLIQRVALADLARDAHPYTRALLEARPTFGKRGQRLSTVADFLPDGWFDHA